MVEVWPSLAGLVGTILDGPEVSGFGCVRRFLGDSVKHYSSSV